MPTIDELWHSNDPQVWAAALERYWDYVQPANLALERSLDRLDLERVRDFDAQAWYDFLRDEYFRWKYTAPNRYATTTQSLSKHVAELGGLDGLHGIKDQLLHLDPTQVRAGLAVATKIGGLGVAGASGLLALMYPAHFGTVDQFVVKALRGVSDLPEAVALAAMNPEGLTVTDGVTLIAIMTRQAAENNRRFDTAEWTPRKIDQVVWTYGR